MMVDSGSVEGERNKYSYATSVVSCLLPQALRQLELQLLLSP